MVFSIMPSFAIHTGQKRCFQKLILSDVKGSCELNSKMLSQEDFSLQRFWIQLSSWNSRFSLKPRRGVYLSTPLKKKRNKLLSLSLSRLPLLHTHPLPKFFQQIIQRNLKSSYNIVRKLQKVNCIPQFWLIINPFFLSGWNLPLQ